MGIRMDWTSKRQYDYTRRMNLIGYDRSSLGNDMCGRPWPLRMVISKLVVLQNESKKCESKDLKKLRGKVFVDLKRVRNARLQIEKMDILAYQNYFGKSIANEQTYQQRKARVLGEFNSLLNALTERIEQLATSEESNTSK